MKKKSLIFDLDGVLVNSLGYIKAFQSAVSFLSQKSGLIDLVPSDDAHAIFESIGISSEWDMTALYFTLALEIYLEKQDHQGSLSLKSLFQTPIMTSSVSSFDVESRIPALKPGLVRGVPAAHAILEAIKKGSIKVFKHLSEMPILIELLSSIQDVTRNLACQLIQNFTNGHQAFSEKTGLSALVQSEPFLEKWDQPIISAGLKDKILRLASSRLIECAICTARPSLRPSRSPMDSGIYFAEAETGRIIAGMQDIRMVGWGSVQALGNLTGIHPAMFLKPQPVQTLAAIACAGGADEWEALQWAFRISSGDHLKGDDSVMSPFELPESLELHVFEDMTNGLVAAKLASQVLQEIGCDVKLHLWGIAQHEYKIQALRSVGAYVTDSVDSAVSQALKEYN